MARKVGILFTVIAALALTISVVSAGSPHFVTVSKQISGNSIIVSGKEAGLGNEDQIHIVVSGTALCINNGGHHPKAVNKSDASSEGDFPVQNGKAEFSLTLTASFDPPCDPPMTVTWVNVTVTDTTNGISIDP